VFWARLSADHGFVSRSDARRLMRERDIGTTDRKETAS
jgi:hypothetical protein